MARNISAAALAKLATDFGTEPINIVEIEWVPDGGRTAYSDRDIPPTVAGKILELGALDNVISVSGGADSSAITLKLDDSDGSIKALFDAHDVHQRPVWVYQWFDGLDLADKFLVFKGQISSPVTWSEGDRTFSFEVVSQIEEKEIGFSPEEGQFSQIPDSLIGRPWPMIFGTCLDVPAVGLTKAIAGSTQQGVGIISGRNLHGGVFTADNANEVSVGVALAHMVEQVSVLAVAGQSWIGIDDEQAEDLRAQANAIRRQMTNAAFSLDESQRQAIAGRIEQLEEMDSSENIGPSVVKILGGEDFPQGVLVTIDINGGLFTGIFDCQDFRILSRRHVENDAKAQELFEQSLEVEISPGPGGEGYAEALGADGPIRRRYNIISPAIVRRRQVQQVAQHFWAEAGSRVVMADDQPQHYIVSTVPGTVLAVKAYKRFEGIRRLVNVPSSLWSQVTRTFGSVTAETVVLSRQLSGIPDQGFEDDIYVTFESSVGPNTVDVMEYLIDTYSDLETDAASFADVKTKLTPFPSNFAIFDRPQIIEILRNIAFQARCAIFVKDDTFFLKYLPEEPASSATVDESDVENKSLVVGVTPTEDLVTKMVVTWRPTYAEDSERKMIFRHNVAKYGIKEEEFDWFIYNQPDIIRKAATFWLIRKSNTWKKLRFRGFLNLLNLETFDGVTLDFSSTFVASGSVKAIVEQANYDSASNKIDFECWVPVKAGSMSQYQFAWPASATGTFPAPGDSAGGFNIGADAIGDLPVGAIRLSNGCATGGGIFIGGPNIVFAGPADLGDPTPQDTGFEAQPVIPAGTDFNVTVTPRPTPDLTLTYATEVPVPQIQTPLRPHLIDIRTTKVYDSENPGTGTSSLASIVRKIDGDGRLVIDVDARFGDDENESEFDFEFDTEGGKFGAGTAFLKDDE